MQMQIFKRHKTFFYSNFERVMETFFNKFDIDFHLIVSHLHFSTYIHYREEN